jgi:CheY-like chemotaxis protein
MMTIRDVNADDALPWYRRAPAAYEAAEPRAEVARKLRVLVVDDNVDAASALSLLVECWGYDVRLAYNGDQALRVAASYCPDAVLLDIGLPGMSGYDVAKRLRAAEYQAQATCTPSYRLSDVSKDPAPRALMVAVTGFGLPEDIAKAKAAGFDHHVLKPSEPGLIESLLARYADHLIATMQRYEQRDRQRDSTEAQPPVLRTDLSAVN